MTCGDYLTFGGVEIINTARAFAYTRRFGYPLACGGCNVPGVQYTTPAADDAPWYDPAVPESARVLGFSGVAVEGIRRGATRRDQILLANGGGVPGRPRSGPRTLRVELIMWAEDECALSYAAAWLAAALATDDCTASCTGSELGVLVCCSATDAAAGLRTLYGAAVSEGPEELESWRSSCGVYAAAVEVMITAGQPFLFRPSLIEVTTVAVNAGPVSLFSPIIGNDADCLPDESCFWPPGCDLPPEIPPGEDFLDPCAPVLPYDAHRQIIAVDDLPSWLSAVPVISVSGGTSGLKNLTFRFNDMGTAGCPNPETQLSICDMRAQFQVFYMGPESTLELDGRARTMRADCAEEQPTSRSTFTPRVFGYRGAPPRWPVFGCGLGACVEISAASASPAPSADALVTIGWAIREDMG